MDAMRMLAAASALLLAGTLPAAEPPKGKGNEAAAEAPDDSGKADGKAKPAGDAKAPDRKKGKSDLPRAAREPLLHLAFDSESTEKAGETLIFKDMSPAGLRAKAKGGASLGEQDGREVLQCDGAGAYAEIAKANSLSFSRQDSYSACVRFFVPEDTPARYQAIIAMSRTAKPHWGLWIDNRKRLCYGGEPDNLSAPRPVAAGWRTAILIQDGAKGTRALYVDGERVVTGAALAADGKGAFQIGYCGYGKEFFKGAIDEVIVIGKALEESDREEIEKFLSR